MDGRPRSFATGTESGLQTGSSAPSRFVAFALMLVGISMLGLITASVAAWFVGQTRAAEDDVLIELRALRVEVAALRLDNR